MTFGGLLGKYKMRLFSNTNKLQIDKTFLYVVYLFWHALQAKIPEIAEIGAHGAGQLVPP